MSSTINNKKFDPNTWFIGKLNKGRLTHMMELNLNVLDDAVREKVMKKIFDLVDGISKEYDCGYDVDCSVTWHMKMDESFETGYLYTNNFLCDKAVSDHFSLFIRDVISDIKKDEKLKNLDNYKDDWSLDYWITKPLSSGIIISESMGLIK